MFSLVFLRTQPPRQRDSATSTGSSEGFKQLRTRGVFNARSVWVAMNNFLGVFGT